MFELNLVRNKVLMLEKRKKIFRYFNIVYFINFLILFLMIIKVVVNNYEIVSYGREKALIQSNIELAKNMLGISKVEQEWIKYSEEVEKINHLYANRTYWAARLREVSAILPKGLCIDQINVSKVQDKENMILNIIASSEDKQELESVNELISSFGKSMFFGKGASMESQQKKEMKDRNVELYRLSIPI
jgi:hypothetical protein